MRQIENKSGGYNRWSGNNMVRWKGSFGWKLFIVNAVSMNPIRPEAQRIFPLPHLHHWYQQYLLDRQNEWRLSHLLVAVQMLPENPWSLSSHPNLWISSRLTPCHIYHPISNMICDWNVCFDEVVHFQSTWEPLQRGRGRTHLPKITCRAACRQIHILWQTAQVWDILVDAHSTTSCVYVSQK